MNRIAICLVPRFAAPSIFPSAGPGMSRTRWWTTCPSAGPSTRRSASIPRSAKLALYNTFLFSILHIFAERLRDGPEVQQVAKGGLHHRQGVQIQGEFHERCQYSFRDAASGKPGDQVREDTAEAVRARGLRVCARAWAVPWRGQDCDPGPAPGRMWSHAAEKM